MLPVSTDRPVLKRTKRDPGRIRNKKTKTKAGALRYVANDFLTQRFPVICEKTTFENENCPELEEEFFLSLKHLSRLYNFTPQINNGIAFPHNIYMSYLHAVKQLESKDKDLTLRIAKQDDKPISLVAQKSINPGWTLYYLPLETIARLHRKKQKQPMLLLLSVFAYLNQVVRMPVLDQNDYLDYSYEMIGEWATECRDEYDDEEWISNMTEIVEFRRKSKVVCKAVCKPEHLALFEDRLNSFTPANSTERTFKKIAQKIHSFYLRYPKHHFYYNIHVDPERDEDDYPIEPDMYFSFFWSSRGWQHDQLMSYIQSDLQDRGYFDAPARTQWFYKPQKAKTVNLNFENKLINLICELANVIDRL